jgi:DNA-binding transcriptional MerR regulator
MTGHRYTLAELADASAVALDALQVAARNGQVRQRPDIRTLRYYGTLGLLDHPAQMVGRTALYAERHLLQVLAVKAVQARGASLAEVQRSLAGATDDELRRAIGPGLPAALGAALAAGPASAGPASAGPAPAGAAPAASAPARPAPASAAPASAAPRAATRDPAFWRTLPSSPAAANDLQPRLMIAIPLAPGATLLLEGSAPEGSALDRDAADNADAEAIRAAAAPLLIHLTGAGLLPGAADTAGS